jgi:hypothetical protein
MLANIYASAILRGGMRGRSLIAHAVRRAPEGWGGAVRKELGEASGEVVRDDRLAGVHTSSRIGYICKRDPPRRNEGKVSYRTCRSAGSVLSHLQLVRVEQFEKSLVKRVEKLLGTID